MPVSAAYIAVILIWSTTPLGIVWSSESVSPTLAVLLRMIIAVIPGWLIIKLSNIELPWHANAIRIYSYSAIGIFGGMLFSYMAARYIGSGLMSLIFGFAPILSGVLAQKILDEPKFSKTKQLALLIALMGLFIVCFDSVSLTSNSLLGIGCVLCGVFFFSLSGVMVKSVEIKINPLATTVGALTFCIPLFTTVWLVFDGTLPIEQWQARSLWAILYLGVFGSLLGFIAYFYVLQKLKASSVALITMMTPIFALYLGALLNDEIITVNLVIGALFVMTGLAIYQWGGRRRTKVAVTS